MLQSNCCHDDKVIAAQGGHLFILTRTSYRLHAEDQGISCESYSLLLHFLNGLHLLLKRHVVVHKANTPQLQSA